MLTDNELWLRIRHDEQKALRIVFDRYYESLCLTAFGIIKDQDLAKEIVADVFVKLWQKRQNIEILHGLRPYLYRCVYNACFDHLKASRPEQTIEITDTIKELAGDDGEYIFKQLSFEDVEKDVLNAIQKLPPHCKEIFCSSRFDLLSYNEISEKYNISVNTVKTQISRALDTLRDHLKKYL